MSFGMPLLSCGVGFYTATPAEHGLLFGCAVALLWQECFLYVCVCLFIFLGEVAFKGRRGLDVFSLCCVVPARQAI